MGLTDQERNTVMTDLIMAVAIEAGLDPRKLYKTMTDKQKLVVFATAMKGLAEVDMKKEDPNFNPPLIRANK
jgi:hypothetical protein